MAALHESLDFNVNMNDDTVEDKQTLIKGGGGYGFDEESVGEKPSAKQQSAGVSGFLGDIFSSSQDTQMSSSRNTASDVLPVSSSAYDLSKSGHPIACICTVAFKLLSFVAYFFFGVHFQNSVFVFVMVLTFDAIDFWTVKNITGRLLVGLRWWNQMNEKGEEEYKYESKGAGYKPNQVDYAFFWSAQLLFSIFWALVTVLHVLSPFWLFLDLITFGLLFTNLYGFYKCKSEHAQKVNAVKDNLKTKGFSILGKYLMKG